MDATKRMPTEMEARMLLRDVARRMEDERTIAEHCARVRPPPGRGLLLFLLTVAAGGAAVFFLKGRELSMALSGAIGCFGMIALSNTIAIAQMAKVTGALARTVERLLAEPPLPRAPSPPPEKG